MTTTTAAPVRSLGLPTGRWVVDARRSHLGVAVRIGGLATVRGRFTDVRGHVDVAAEPERSAVVAEIRTGSLTSGSPRWDRILTAAGLVDAAAHPVLTYRSTALRALPTPGRWRLDGVLTTRRGAERLTFALAGPTAGADGRAGFRARAKLPAVVAAQLLARRDAELLLGPDLALDLQVEVAKPGDSPR
ncbi:YceI family protein [Pseudonocardia nigra]|uniref:YceI family protein n=1 Tax=Pseudonocardia nigra TaxID=1921578 RepID=UPI001C5DAC05|nr:YceI family protein [Pseudonocardia nigra]